MAAAAARSAGFPRSLAIAAETWGTDILLERSYLWLVASRLFFLTAGGILFAYVTAYLSRVFLMSQEEAGMTNLALIDAALRLIDVKST